MYKEHNVKIIRKKIKNSYIRVKNGEIVVTTNHLTPKVFIMKLIYDNEKAIDKMIEKDKKNKAISDDFYLFGNKYDIVYDDNIDNIIVKEKEIMVKNVIELNKYLDLTIKEVFSERLDHWYNEFTEKIPIPNLKIRKMTSRWGVCNTRNNNITLNYYLHKYDIECLDYVIVHELSHFIEANHSSNFWKVVAKYYPNYKEAKKKLRS